MSEQHPANLEVNNEADQRPDVLPGQEGDDPSDAGHEIARQNALETSRQQIEREAKSAESVKIGETANEPVQHLNVDKELKDIAYGRLVNRARRQLNGPNKLFSRLIHKPTVDRISRLGEKTIARPSGIMGGGITALVGSSLLLYTAKHYGFRYNFLAFALLFILGYAVGTLIELLFKLKKLRG